MQQKPHSDDKMQKKSGQSGDQNSGSDMQRGSEGNPNRQQQQQGGGSSQQGGHSSGSKQQQQDLGPRQQQGAGRMGRQRNPSSAPDESSNQSSKLIDEE
jgi:hypothetical protein